MGYGSSSRGGATVLWVTLHTAEGARSARALANFFDGNSAASSHVAIDSSEILWMVGRARAAWTLGPGNPNSMNAELCGFARWSRAQWLSTGVVDGCANPREMVRRAAAWAKGECDHWGIPYHRIGPAAVSGWQGSIIHHDDYTKGSGWGSHWDVGPNFPWDVFFADLTGSAPPSGGGSSYMEYPLPAGHYYGDIEGPTESHGGFYVSERPIVRRIQQRFQELGFAPSYASWADGKWEPPTTEACKAWQHSVGLPVTGTVDADDWAKLFPRPAPPASKREMESDPMIHIPAPHGKGWHSVGLPAKNRASSGVCDGVWVNISPLNARAHDIKLAIYDEYANFMNPEYGKHIDSNEVGWIEVNDTQYWKLPSGACSAELEWVGDDDKLVPNIYVEMKSK